MAGNFVKLDRKILEWPWYSDVNTKTLFIHCLLKANWQEKRWKGYVCKRGQLITSLSILSHETGLTIRQTRTALEHLTSTGELASWTDGKIRIITVQNYDKYQLSGKAADKQTTNKRQADKQGGDKVATTTKEYKEYLRNKEGGCAADCPSGDDLPKAENDYIDNYYANR